MQNQSIRDSFYHEKPTEKQHSSQGQTPDPLHGSNAGGSPLKAKFGEDQDLKAGFLSTEELIPGLKDNIKNDKEASESLLRAFAQSSAQQSPEQELHTEQIYRETSLSSTNIRQMLAILFQKCEDVMSISDLFVLNNLSGGRVFFDCLSFLQAALAAKGEPHTGDAFPTEVLL